MQTGRYEVTSEPMCDVERDELSYPARSFVPYYAQRISHAIVMHGAAGVHKGITRMQCARLRHTAARAV